MNLKELFDALPLWATFLASLGVTLLALQLGFQAGKRRRVTLTGEEKLHTAPITAASMSLLAFMLAMAFSGAQSRLGDLKRVALDEANAIGTAYLRADLLPGSDREEIRQLLHEYVNLRIEAGRSGAKDEIERAIDTSEELQSDLWSRAVTIAGQHPTRLSGLFLQSLNELISLHEKRITLAIAYRLPGSIWLVLYGLAILAMMLGGYDIGASGSHRMLAITLFTALAFSVVLLLIVALDRPHHHLSVRQAAMIDLQENIQRSMQSQP
jgi:hypothetical protein